MSDLLAKALHGLHIGCLEAIKGQEPYPGDDAATHASDAAALRNHPDHASIAAELLTEEERAEAAMRDAALIHAALRLHGFTETCPFCVDAKDRAERMIEEASERVGVSYRRPQRGALR